MVERLDPADVLDLFIVELSGQKLTSLQTSRARLEMSLSMAPLDGDPHQSRVGVSVQTFGLAEGADDDDASTPLYEGSAAYVIRFVDDGDDDVTLDGLTVINFVWPYLRSGLIEQAARLGTLRLQLPLEIDPASLALTETPSDAAGPPVA